MVKEQYEKLKEWENVLINAKEHNFIHLSSGEFAKIAEIYNEVFETAITKREMNCNMCRLKALKKLAEEYVTYKNKRKGGRPRKIDLENGEETQ